MASIFLTYRIFCLTQFTVWYVDVREYVVYSDNDSMAHYYFFWIIITLLIMLYGFRSNMLFVIMQGLQGVLLLLLTSAEGTKEGDINKVARGFAVAVGWFGCILGLDRLLMRLMGRWLCR